MQGKAMIEKALRAIGLKEDEVKIYFKLLEQGSATAGELAKTTGIIRTTLYTTLQRMTKIGVVSRTLRAGVRSFSAAHPEKIEVLFDERIARLNKHKADYSAALPDLLKKVGGKLLAPKVQIYEGLEGVQNVFKDILMYPDIDTYSFWPLKTMVNNLGADYWDWHNKERIKNNTKIYAIRSRTQDLPMKKAPYMGGGDAFKRWIRIAPDDVDFTMGYWIYANKIALLSSSKERIGMIIESAEMAEMMKTQWRYIWKDSTPLEFDIKDCEPFLDKL